MAYRHRLNPELEIEAVEVTGDNLAELVAWLNGRDATITETDDGLVLTAGEDDGPVRTGEWLIDVDGEITPCSGDGFAATFEPV